MIKTYLAIIFILLSLTGCAHKSINGTNDFHSLINSLVDDSSEKLKSTISLNDVVLVSDFVNLDKLKNKSKLGFLLSDILKERLSSLDIITKQIEFGKELELGNSGLNFLTRNTNKIISTKIEEINYAVVGTYSITTEKLNVFIKLININNGYILASSYESISIDEEILELERKEKKVQNLQERGQNIRPQVVL